MKLVARALLSCAALVTSVALLATAPAQAQAKKPNVLVILVDAMRADVLGPYGYKVRKTTPNLDKLAARGAVWERMISQDAWTVPCVASLFTGMDPQAHRTLRYDTKERKEMDAMSLEQDTMAEQFKAGGYTTAAFLKSVVIDSSRGFSQGFDKYEVVGGADQAWGESAKQLNDVAIPWVVSQKSASKPFFAYLHYMDAHSPYKAPEPWYSKYKGNYAGKLTGAHLELEALHKAGQKPSAEDLAYIKGLYDAEIEYWDSQFGRLMGEMATAGLDKNTIVVVTADHGEAFWEHDNVFHGHLWQENIHIPSVWAGPGIPAGTRVKHFSQQIDIAPTLADLTGVPKGRHWMGNSQAEAMKSGKSRADVVYSEYIGMKTVIEPSGLKLITGDGPDKLFDLSKDPGEKNNLAAARPADVQRLRALAEQRHVKGKELAAKFPAEAAKKLTPEEIEMLRALGYTE